MVKVKERRGRGCAAADYQGFAAAGLLRLEVRDPRCNYAESTVAALCEKASDLHGMTFGCGLAILWCQYQVLVVVRRCVCVYLTESE